MDWGAVERGWRGGKGRWEEGLGEEDGEETEYGVRQVYISNTVHRKHSEVHEGSQGKYVGSKDFKVLISRNVSSLVSWLLSPGGLQPLEDWVFSLGAAVAGSCALSV